MVYLKTDEEIEIMKVGGKILKKVGDELIQWIQPGMSTAEVDQKAEALILDYGATPSFKTVKGYKWATCLPINEQAVHTPPSKRKLLNGDVLTVDVGVLYKGYHTDYADTILIGDKKDDEAIRFLRVGKETLDEAIKLVKDGQYLGVLASYIEKEIKGAGYHILKDLTGHGIGRSLHEDPYVFNYVDRPTEKTYKIRKGLVIAVEIIYSVGSSKIAYEPGNDWSIISSDSSLSACFEKTIAVSENKVFILT